MVETISPTYYATGQHFDEIELIGNHLLGIPSDAVGVLATSNDNPTQFVGTTLEALLLDIVERSNTRLLLRIESGSTASNPIYLGAIASRSGNVVYWVNDTRPLP